MKSLSRRSIWIALVSVGLLARCASFGTAGRIEPAELCRGNLDCDYAPGSTCHPTRQICVIESWPARPVPIGFEIAIPGTMGGLPSVAVVPVESTTSNEMNIVVPRRFALYATLRAADDTKILPNVELTFTPDGQLPGRDNSLRATELTTPIEIGGVRYEYTASLFRDVVYTVTVSPLGSDAEVYPPVVFPSMLRAPVEADIFPLEIRFPESTVLRGEVKDTAGRPQVNARLRAVTPDGREFSSLGRTNGRGEFSITLSAGTSSAAYLIRVESESSTGPLPTLVVDPRRVWPDEQGIARILVPQFERRAARYSARVEGYDGRALFGASVQFRADSVVDPETGARGTLQSAPFMTNSLGEFEAALLPGMYDLVVTPPRAMAAQNYGVLAQRVVIAEESVGADLRGQVFTLPERVLLSARVRSFSLRPVSGANVSANPLPPSTSPDFLARATDAEIRAAVFSRTRDDLTSSSGTVDAKYDSGVYHFLIRPSFASGLPWTYVYDQALTRASGLGSDRTVLDVTVGVPRVIRGRVIDTANQRISGARVDVFTTRVGTASRTDLLGVGSAISDSNGAFELLVDSSL